MRKLLLASVFALAAVPALADNIVVTATVDGTMFFPFTSPTGSLDLNNQSFGGVFNLNTVTVSSSTFLSPPGVLSTNTLDVDQTVTGNHTLVLDIKAFNIAGLAGLTDFLSSFSVTGQSTSGWTAREQTFINGLQLADTGPFNAVADSAFSTNGATIGSTFTAEAIYTIHSVGEGQFNGGIDISVAVPGPVVGAGLPALLGLFGMGGFSFWRRRRCVSA